MVHPCLVGNPAQFCDKAGPRLCTAGSRLSKPLRESEMNSDGSEQLVFKDQATPLHSALPYLNESQNKQFPVVGATFHIFGAGMMVPHTRKCLLSSLVSCDSLAMCMCRMLACIGEQSHPPHGASLVLVAPWLVLRPLAQ